MTRAQALAQAHLEYMEREYGRNWYDSTDQYERA